MPRIDDVYPDKFMKAAHIDEWLSDSDEEHAILTIKSTGMAEYSDGKKQILLRFKETHLELGLNKGNGTALAEAFGSEESDDWIGKKVALHTERVKNSMAPGGFSQGIRVSDRQTVKANRPTQKAPTAQTRGGPTEGPIQRPRVQPVTQAEADEDDIPFDGDTWPKGRE